MTADGNGITLGYDLRQRLATLTTTAGTTRYTYDAGGQRVRKAGPATGTVLYVYDPQGQLLGEYDSAGRAIREYVWLHSMPVAIFTPQSATSAVTAPPVVYYLHADHLGTPRVAMDTSGNVRWSWLADPFGASAANEAPTASMAPLKVSLRLPGQVFDQESGLHYNYMRDYFPGTGRYVQSDPIGLRGGVNTFAYVGGHPLSYSDPSGLCPLFLAVPLVGGGITAADVAAGLAGASAMIGLDRMLSSGLPRGFIPGDKGAEQWGRNNGVDPNDARGRFHGIKQSNKGRGRDRYGVNPQTGEVCDPNGDIVGDLDDAPRK
ncbi:RHS repeat-associated core domain-containing protein [Acidovorax sp. FG27]|uniref:RHS repeat-associated core domain-containing protein n=1 Tax=Acidovorax sp. FG27 TaxID=3133652 RepID=UPI0030E8E9C0